MTPTPHADVALRRDGDVLVVELSGDWSVHAGIPSTDAVDRELAAESRGGPPALLSYATDRLGTWDSSLMAFLVRTAEVASTRGVPEDRGGHGVPRDLVIAELTEAGFAHVRTIEPWWGRNYLILFRRP